MKKKQIVKIIIDICMTILLFVLISFHYAGFLLMGFHIGLHYGMILAMVRKAVSIFGTAKQNEKKKGIGTWIFRGIAVLIAIYGAHALYARKFMDYISQKVMFAFFDYEEPGIYFVLDYVAIMGLMIFIACYLQRFLQRKISSVNTDNQKQKE